MVIYTTSTDFTPGKTTSITEHPDLNSTEGFPTRNDIAFFITQFRFLSMLSLPESAIYDLMYVSLWCMFDIYNTSQTMFGHRKH